MKLFKKRNKERMISDPVDSSEEVRLRMVEISNKLTPIDKNNGKKSFSLFKRKEKLEEKYCHTCKHNLALHHKRGRSTGCRKCGCLRTLEEIMNPTDNGHKDNKEINTT